MRPAVLTLLLIAAALTGCAYAAPAPVFLAGKPLDSASAVFGPWVEHRQVGGRDVYIWRAHAKDNGVDTVCELQVTTSYRDTITNSDVRGYPAACRRFSVALAKPPRRRRSPPSPDRPGKRGPASRDQYLTRTVAP